MDLNGKDIHGNTRSRWAVVLTMSILVFSNLYSTASAGTECQTRGQKGRWENPKDGACGTRHIKHNVSNLRELENCTIIEGSLHIMLIEYPTGSESDNYSFPLLKEITGYLVLYRVRNLRSMKQLFPNLAIIRGQNLFYNYALVAYENAQLEEVGLISLRVIVRGGIRITKNRKMCYVDTIDWSKIALGAEPSEHHLMDNKEESQCANVCPKDCAYTTVDGIHSQRCWSSQHCQKNLQKCNTGRNGCKLCTDDGSQCCNDNCLGGCTGSGPGDCIGCQKIVYMNMCQPKCPDGTFKWYDMRCLTDKQCLAYRNRTGERRNLNTKLLRATDKGSQSVCVMDECPPGYMVAEEGKLEGQECIRCKEYCPKVCNSTSVNSIQDAQKLKGCSKIRGPLVIQIMGGSSVATEMSDSLGDIREVTHYVYIRKSYALLTLDFLRKLEVIHGQELLHNGKSLIVMDNMNLQELFNKDQKIQIKRGTVSFHTNRRLCLYKIQDFVATLNLTKEQEPTENDISSATNGDLMPCASNHMNLTVHKSDHGSATLRWNKDTQDSRQLLAYNIYYKELSKDDERVDRYMGRDACSDDIWQTSEQPPKEGPEDYEEYEISDLKPFTRYAAYVQSFTLASAAHTSITDIITFQTSPYIPSEPRDALAVAHGEGTTTLKVTWKPPAQPNGLIHTYAVEYKEEKRNPETYLDRDYCKQPIINRNKTKSVVDEKDKTPNRTGNCCACPKSKRELDNEQDKRTVEVYFENYLHNSICKRKALPVGVVVPAFSIFGFVADRKESKQQFSNVTEDYATTPKPNNGSHYKENSSGEKLGYALLFNNTTEFVISKLKPYTSYVIKIKACHKKVNDSQQEMCSPEAITEAMTNPLWSKDLINETTITVKLVSNNSRAVYIRWKPPPDPNGVIVKYNLKYRKNSQENLVPHTICIRQTLYATIGGYKLEGLEAGNYSFQINAVSLSGNSSFTQERYFIIPNRTGGSSENNTMVIIVVLVFLVILVIAFIIIGMLIKYRWYKHNDMTVISQNMNYMPSSDLIDTMDGWEVDRDKIRILEPLGKGSFGMVYKGLAKGIRDDPDEDLWVAVKTVNDRANFFERRDFLKEATTMKAFDCYHVVKLLGVVSTGQPALVIMELMSKDLKNYLRERRPDELEPGMSPPRLQDILQMAGEIADGMAYLADKKFVHRDLAARNCMVAEDTTVKIGDFGMARDIYETDYYRKGGKGMLPVRWMAPESLRDGVFTTMSDVWSFGVVLWEMVTLAAQPYQGLSNEEVVKFISDGNTMAVPEQCPDQMEKLMLRCWKWKPKDRPSFINIIQFLEPHLHNRYRELSFYFNAGVRQSHGDGAFGSPPKLDLGDNQGASSSLGQDYDFESSPHSQDKNFSSGLTYSDHNDYQDGVSDRFSSLPKNHESYEDDIRAGEGYFELDDESFEDGTDFMENGDDFPDGNNSRCFMGEEYQPLSSGVSVSMSTPSPSSTKENDPMSHPSLPSQGLFELQPLISKDTQPSVVSPHTLPSLDNKLQSSHPASVSPSDYMGYNPVLQESDTGLNAPRYDSQPPRQNNELVFPLPAAPGQVSMKPGLPRLRQNAPPQSHLPSALESPSVPGSGNNRPSLRLPVLNQPPGVGFRRAPLVVDPGDNQNFGSNVTPSNSSSVPSSNDSQEHKICVNEENIPPVLVTSSNPSSPTGAIDSISSDESKDSTKSSGSHSLINGLTNGHPPSSTLHHRTALC